MYKGYHGKYKLIKGFGHFIFLFFMVNFFFHGCVFRNVSLGHVTQPSTQHCEILLISVYVSFSLPILILLNLKIVIYSGNILCLRSLKGTKKPFFVLSERLALNITNPNYLSIVSSSFKIQCHMGHP